MQAKPPESPTQSLGESMQRVLDAVRERGPVTDKELCASIDLPDGAIRPARLRLYRRGLVEPSGSGGWVAVPPERQAEVREQAESKPRRRRKLADLSLGERLSIVTVLLRDDEVNQALQEQTEDLRGQRRARARAREAQGDGELARRQRRAEAARAEKEKSTYVDFLKTRNHLKDAVEVILGVRRFLVDDFARVGRGESPRIPATTWPDVLHNVSELLTTAAVLHREIHSALENPYRHCPLCGVGEIEPEVIDAEVVSELVELTGGD